MQGLIAALELLAVWPALPVDNNAIDQFVAYFRALGEASKNLLVLVEHYRAIPPALRVHLDRPAALEPLLTATPGELAEAFAHVTSQQLDEVMRRFPLSGAGIHSDEKGAK